MEGKEVRFGVGDSALFATVTTAASCGAVNAMHDSFTPLGGSCRCVNIMLGEVIFGGVGAGLYGMFVFIVLAVFIAGLMVGRTPEYLGKKIEAKDVKLAMLDRADLRRSHPRRHGRRGGDGEPARRASTTPGRTGSQRDDVRVHQRHRQQRQRLRRPQREHEASTTSRLGLAMFFGRFLMIIPIMGIAGSLAAKKKRRGDGRHVPGRRPAVHVPSHRRDRHRRRADVLPGALARAATSSTS